MSAKYWQIGDRVLFKNQGKEMVLYVLNLEDWYFEQNQTTVPHTPNSVTLISRKSNKRGVK